MKIYNVRLHWDKNAHLRILKKLLKRKSVGMHENICVVYNALVFLSFLLEKNVLKQSIQLSLEDAFDKKKVFTQAYAFSLKKCLLCTYGVMWNILQVCFLMHERNSIVCYETRESCCAKKTCGLHTCVKKLYTFCWVVKCMFFFNTSKTCVCDACSKRVCKKCCFMHAKLSSCVVFFSCTVFGKKNTTCCFIPVKTTLQHPRNLIESKQWYTVKAMEEKQCVLENKKTVWHKNTMVYVTCRKHAYTLCVGFTCFMKKSIFFVYEKALTRKKKRKSFVWKCTTLLRAKNICTNQRAHLARDNKKELVLKKVSRLICFQRLSFPNVAT